MDLRKGNIASRFRVTLVRIRTSEYWTHSKQYIPQEDTSVLAGVIREGTSECVFCRDGLLMQKRGRVPTLKFDSAI